MFFTITLTISTSCSLTAQNLIPNPGFDEIISCPNDPNSIESSVHWQSASDGKPQILNTCGTAFGYSVPNAGSNQHSYQQPRSGNGYAHIYTYGTIAPDEGLSQYLQVKLSDTLEKHETYYAEFYVSPDVQAPHALEYSDAIGLALSDTLIDRNLDNPETLDHTPIIENFGDVILDSVGWTRIGGCFKATGTEAYATVGNFRSLAETTLFLEGSATFPHVVQFYIEDVLIEKFDPLPDTMIACRADQNILDATFHHGTYIWSTGETSSSILPLASGMYTVEVMIEGCSLRDTTVVIFPDEITLDIDREECMDEPVTLTATLPGSYLWSDGTTGPSIMVKEEGVYNVEITTSCGLFSQNTSLSLVDCACNFFVPNVFSPNGDGLNDLLAVSSSCRPEITNFQFAIIDRWGNMVYQAIDPQRISWDGTFKNEMLDSGVFTYVLSYELNSPGGNIDYAQKSGDLTLIR